MKNFFGPVLLFLVLLFASCHPIDNPIDGDGLILFDEGHAQTAGNADWVIDGGYSEFADALKEKGYSVESTDDPFDYSTLARYDVVIIPEPNIRFSSDEISALKRYVENGGSVFFIGNHSGADRNNDGWDPVEIFNEVVNDDFGFRFDSNTVSEDPIEDILVTPITYGVNAVGMWAGSTITIINDSKVHVAIRAYEKPYVVYGYYGSGKFVAIGDSSPFDDGDGDPGDNLYDNWYDYDDSVLAVNIVDWLSK
ncbi:DUF4350 domain-containing protein [Kosmotoga olearia]|uniref:DUF4350 domain-containing protein n=1 Tax=Kosmotoga olearia (strain ATCC BAA-1733 / DSM 21960 / TBF 19.5.1) TaxID=521045 RepID=C5CI21_KOSOT|nr:DUF4350 domain-containing protein [Kosmotoga olearia]ACR79800.1 conserved hypothetical protein [Kosmotoga olearia TBF 19.5.1]